MSQVSLKIYGAFWPAAEDGRAAVAAAGASALGAVEDWLFLEGDLLRLSFEGVWFPLEEVLATLSAHLAVSSQGRLDALDLDAWTLTRYIWAEGSFRRSSRDLNNVLDFSGF